MSVTGVIQAYRFAPDPTSEQETALRYAFDWGLTLVRAVVDQRRAESSYGLPDAELMPPVNWSAYALRTLWNGVKNDIAPWWAENSKEAYASGLVNADSSPRLQVTVYSSRS